MTDYLLTCLPNIHHSTDEIKLGKRKQYLQLQCFSSNNTGLREMLHRRSPFVLTVEFRYDTTKPRNSLVQSKVDAEDAGGAGVSR